MVIETPVIMILRLGMRSMSLAVLLQCRQRQCSTNFQFFEWPRAAGTFITFIFRANFFSGDVGCLFRWRWTVEVASSTLSVEAAFTMSPGRGDIRDIHNVCHSRWKLPPVLQYSSTLSVEALRPLSPCHRGEEIYEIYNVCHSMSCLVSSVHARHESRTRVGAETCAYSPSNMFICLSSDVVM